MVRTATDAFAESLCTGARILEARSCLLVATSAVSAKLMLIPVTPAIILCIICITLVAIISAIGVTVAGMIRLLVIVKHWTSLTTAMAVELTNGHVARRIQQRRTFLRAIFMRERQGQPSLAAFGLGRIEGHTVMLAPFFFFASARPVFPRLYGMMALLTVLLMVSATILW